jgi:hypothetical protein
VKRSLFFINGITCWAWWYPPIIPALRRLSRRIRSSRPARDKSQDPVTNKERNKQGTIIVFIEVQEAVTLFQLFFLLAD